MKLWDIVKTIGSAAISTAVPGGPFILGAINSILPDDKKLPETATGHEISSAIGSLPPEQQASIMEKEYDVTLEEIKQSHNTVRAMLESDANNPHSTRPYIAKGSFHVVAFSIITVVSVWAYGVFIENKSIVEAITEGWPFVLAVITPLVVLLHAYFGILKKEHKNRLDAANGSAAPAGIVGLVSSLFKKG